MRRLAPPRTASSSAHPVSLARLEAREQRRSARAPRLAAQPSPVSLLLTTYAFLLGDSCCDLVPALDDPYDVGDLVQREVECAKRSGGVENERSGRGVIPVLGVHSCDPHASSSSINVSDGRAQPSVTSLLGREATYTPTGCSKSRSRSTSSRPPTGASRNCSALIRLLRTRRGILRPPIPQPQAPGAALGSRDAWSGLRSAAQGAAKGLPRGMIASRES